MSSVGVQLQTADNENAYPRPYFRIGDILESTNPNNPADDGYIGTWELYGKGRVTVCIDTSDSNFNTVNKTVGSNTHKLTVKQMPSHNHTGFYWQGTRPISLNGGSTSNGYCLPWSSGSGNDTTDFNTGSQGNSQAHNNIQKSIVVYRWRRIA